MRGERAIVTMINDIYASAGLDREYFNDSDLKALARAVVSAYVAKIGKRLRGRKRVDLACAKFAFEVMQVMDVAEPTKAEADLSRFRTEDLLGQVMPWTQ